MAAAAPWLSGSPTTPQEQGLCCHPQRGQLAGLHHKEGRSSTHPQTRTPRRCAPGAGSQEKRVAQRVGPAQPGTGPRRPRKSGMVQQALHSHTWVSGCGSHRSRGEEKPLRLSRWQGGTQHPHRRDQQAWQLRGRPEAGQSPVLCESLRSQAALVTALLPPSWTRPQLPRRGGDRAGWTWHPGAAGSLHLCSLPLWLVPVWGTSHPLPALWSPFPRPGAGRWAG